jgi:hypothetical protein
MKALSLAQNLRAGQIMGNRGAHLVERAREPATKRRFPEREHFGKNYNSGEAETKENEL